MSEGYKVSVLKRDYEVEGITGGVSRERRADVEYPCIVVGGGGGKYKYEILGRLVRGYKGEPGGINVYVRAGEKTLSAGKIGGGQVRGLIELFQDEGLEGWYKEGKSLAGEYLYVLG